MDSVLVVCLDSNLCCILLPKLSFQNRNPFALSITFLKTFKISFAYRINSNLRGGLLIEQLFCFRVGREGIEIRWLIRCFPDGSDSKASVYNAGDLCSIPGLGRSPGEGIATHSSILAWKIPWMEEPGKLQSTGLQRIGHNWVTPLTQYILATSS